ncbi:MAG: DUF2911 domain-containing protein [Acidipila sp.]|nr:DUF2911 domain-containing protein [Acidipila sp.]
MPPNGDNQKAEVSQWIGLVQISIAYHSPRVHNPPNNDRTGHIWGELVHFGFFDEGFGPSKSTPWRAGANESTTITFSHDVKVGNQDLKAGRYALFLEVAKTGPWNWIFSNDSHGWGSYQYDPKNDALRVPVVPEEAPFTEFMTFGFDDRTPNSAVGFLQWEKKRIPFKIDVPNVNELYSAQMEQELLSWPGFNYRNWQTAAQFSADNKVNLEKALLWADKAISEPFRGAVTGREDFSTLHTKSAVLEAMGRTADADATMQQALTLPATSAADVYRYGMHLLGEKRTAKALESFKINQQRHPDEKFWTYLGLARGYTATGDKKNAIANWQIALSNVPANLSSSIGQFQAALAALKESN